MVSVSDDVNNNGITKIKTVCLEAIIQSNNRTFRHCLGKHVFYIQEIVLNIFLQKKSNSNELLVLVSFQHIYTSPKPQVKDISCDKTQAEMLELKYN